MHAHGTGISSQGQLAHGCSSSFRHGGLARGRNRRHTQPVDYSVVEPDVRLASVVQQLPVQAEEPWLHEVSCQLEASEPPRLARREVGVAVLCLAIKDNFELLAGQRCGGLGVQGARQEGLYVYTASFQEEREERERKRERGRERVAVGSSGGRCGVAHSSVDVWVCCCSSCKFTEASRDATSIGY